MITITTNTKGVYLNEVQVEDTLAAAIVRRGKLVKVISDTKVVIRPDLNTPGIWKLPLEILKRIYIIPVLFMLFSCVNEAQQTIQPNDTEIELELLFVHDGCEVYRFLDGTRYVYWSDCRGGMQSSYYQSNGKTGSTHYKQTINTGRK